MPPDVKALESELNARKHAHYERFMKWYRDEVTEDFILWSFQRINALDKIIAQMDPHDAIRISYEQGCLNTIKEVAHGAMFRAYVADRERDIAARFKDLALARGFDPKTDWDEAGDLGNSRGDCAV